VGSNFLEDIGFDVDFSFNAGTKWGWISLNQEGAKNTVQDITDVPGSFGRIPSAGELSAHYDGGFLNDAQVDFLIRATQGRSDTQTLSAPRATVLSGESALFNLANVTYYALPPDIYLGVQPGLTTGTVGTTSQVQHKLMTVISGNVLMVTPTIMKDKKNVLLSINLLRNKFLGVKTQQVTAPIPGFAEAQNYEVTTPEVETTELSTRVLVPDRGTLLLGGQRVTAQVDKEFGVPVLSKIPILGRVFSSQSKVQDEMVLLLLVKPTILILEERESEAIRAMQAAEAHAF
jgi:type II secretory pathway component GspD/PulD (secretin)